MTIPHQKTREKLLKNPEFVRELEALEPEFSLAEAMIRARAEAGLTQAEIARRMGEGSPAATSGRA